MFYTELGVDILALAECSLIRSPAQFWAEYGDPSLVLRALEEHPTVRERADRLRARFETAGGDVAVLCAFDGEFPPVNAHVKESERPFLLFCRGNRNLLCRLGSNVAVIGTTDPGETVARREREIVSALVAGGMTVVGGLAKGCDEIAHRVAVEKGAPTVAILPSSLERIVPASNRKLAEEIAETGGLLVTEYFAEPLTKERAVGRYIERDRLQALFSKAVVLIASCRYGQGNSGSRHAMEYAEAYRVPRFALYDETDRGERRLGLNREYVEAGKAEKLTAERIGVILRSPPPETVSLSAGKPRQLRLF